MDGQFVCWHVPTQVLSGLTYELLCTKHLELIELTSIQSNNKFTEAASSISKCPWVTPKLSLMQSDDTEGNKGDKSATEPDTKNAAS